MIQGEVLKRVRGRVFAKKRDQRLAHVYEIAVSFNAYSSQGADQGSPKEFPQVHVNARVGLVHHHPEDQASYRKVGQNSSVFVLILYFVKARPERGAEAFGGKSCGHLRCVQGEV